MTSTRSSFRTSSSWTRRALAAEQGLPPWWLNEQASAYVAPGGDPAAPTAFDHPGLRVLTASPEHLLAMKALAARRHIMKLMEADGWYRVSQVGSHRQYKHAVKPGRVTIAGKPSQDVYPKMERSILQQAGLIGGVQ